MSRPVLLDTSFLIAYSDPIRPSHNAARHYLFEARRAGIPLLLSTIVVAEFERRQEVKTLGLSNFQILPFNFEDAQAAAKLADKILPFSTGDNRKCLAADVKIIAHAQRSNAAVLLTEDRKTMAKYINALRALNVMDCYPVLPADGFDAARLSTPAVPSLPLPLP